MKTALITGVTGQDGSYLAELLLEKDYEVYGMVRRTSTESLERIKHLPITIVSGDLLDQQSINRIVDDIRPDELYNLAAQSFVHASFEQPIFTGDCTGLGVTRVLEAVRDISPSTKFYQASSSEIFGKIVEEPQTETTPFYPRSPYGIAKLYGYWMTINYRESYGIHASNGILFNHECLKYDYPIFIRDNNWLKIMSIEEFATTYANFNQKSNNKSGTPLTNLDVWDDNKWTNINCVSWFKNVDKSLKIINARNAVYCVSDDHVCITEDGTDKPANTFNLGDKVKTTNYPQSINISTISLEEAELMGMLVGDGCVSSKHFTNKDVKLRERFAYLWTLVTGGSTKYYPSTSGFSGEEVGRLDLSGGSEWLKKYEFYSESKDVFGHRYKQIPHVVLNSIVDIMEAFLVGYNACDGLKLNLCTYQFKNFKTNSPILAAGLLYLVSQVTNQRYNITVEESWNYGKQQFYYSINLLSDQQTNIEKANLINKLRGEGIVSQREIHRRTGISRTFIRKVFNGYLPSQTHHLELVNNEVKKIIHVNSFNYNGYWFDLETKSGTFHAGIGQGVIHNSPRRGLEFVTRKISQAVAKIALGIQDKLYLGNLDAERDWGFAGDYVEAMWLMLQQENPDDYVVATGERHSVRKFCDIAFNIFDMNYKDYVEVDKRFWRPAEVNILRGDSSKARRVLGWEPKVNFQELVEMMVVNDYHALSQKC